MRKDSFMFRDVNDAVREALTTASEALAGKRDKIVDIYEMASPEDLDALAEMYGADVVSDFIQFAEARRLKG